MLVPAKFASGRGLLGGPLFLNSVSGKCSIDYCNTAYFCGAGNSTRHINPSVIQSDAVCFGVRNSSNKSSR